MSLRVPENNRRRSEGAVAAAVVDVGCGLDLPGSSRVAGLVGQFILSGQTEEAPARTGATRGGERACPTSHPEVRVGGGVVWGLTRIREVQSCGFNCC